MSLLYISNTLQYISTSLWLMGLCDTMNDHKLIINQCDLYLMLESFWGYIKAAFQSRTALFIDMFSSNLLYALVSRCLLITC